MRQLSARAIFSTSIGLCVLIAALAWWLLGDSIDSERSGLKLIAHYARIPDGTGLLRLGMSSRDDIVLPDFSTEDSARLLIGKGAWKLTPGTGGRASEGAILSVPGRYLISFNHRRVKLELNDTIQIEIRRPGYKPSITFINSKLGNTKELPEIDANLVPGTNGMSIFRNGKFQVLKKDDKISIGETRLTWTKQEPFRTPLVLTRSEGSGSPEEHLIWPGSSLYLPEEQLMITAGGGRSRPVRISSTNPEPDLTVSPDVGNVGIVNGSIGDFLSVGSKHYRLAVLRESNDKVRVGTELAVLLRSPEGFNPWRFLWGGSFQSWNDPAVFHPYTFIPVAACGSTAPSTAIWIPSVSRNPSIQDISTTLESSTLVAGRYSLISLIPPNWMDQAQRDRPVVVCTSGSAFQITSFAGDGSAAPAPLDGILGPHDATLRLPGRETLTSASAGDAIFYAGRVYLLTGANIPFSLKLFVGLTPFVFVVAAMPLVWILSNRLAIQRKQLLRTESGIDLNRFLRLGAVIAPTIGLAAIVGMMTVGGYFQLRLATSSQLAGHPKYYNVFLTSCVEALAFAAVLVKWLESKWSSAGLIKAISFGCLSLGLSTAILLWVEPALYKGLATSIQPTELAFQQRTGASWLIPGLFLFLAAIIYRWATCRPEDSMGGKGSVQAEGTGAIQRRPTTLVKNLSGRWSWFQNKFAEHYYTAYEKIGLPSPSRPSTEASSLTTVPDYLHTHVYRVRPLVYLWELVMYFLRLLFFYVTWLLFPLWRFVRSEYSEQFQWKLTTRRACKVSLVFAVCELPVFAVFVAAKLNPQVANVGKQALPPLLVLWAAWILGRVSVFAQNEQRSLRDSDGTPRPLSVAITLLCALAFAAGMFFLPRFFNWIYEPKVMMANWCAIMLVCIAIWILPEWRVCGIMLFHVLPFFGVLFLTSLAFSDYGALLVWTWTLSWIGAWALMLNVLLADPRKVWYICIGNLLCSLLLLGLPLTLLGTFNLLRGDSNAFIGTLGMNRALGRFRLAAAPFYYDAGEWLANVQLMAVGEKNVHWIPNLNSDVALNGLHYLLPREHYLFAGLFFLVIVLLAAAFGETFRYAVRSTGVAESTENLQAALITATALFGIGMLLFVHLGASLFDILPLTGVPCPWLSHSLVTHIVMTSLTVVVLVFASDCALRDRGGIHA